MPQALLERCAGLGCPLRQTGLNGRRRQRICRRGTEGRGGLPVSPGSSRNRGAGLRRRCRNICVRSLSLLEPAVSVRGRMRLRLRLNGARLRAGLPLMAS